MNSFVALSAVGCGKYEKVASGKIATFHSALTFRVFVNPADTKVLFSYPNDIRVAKILVAANYSGVSITVPIVPFPEAAEADEWKSKNPLNQFPWLDTPHGALFHTNAILRYVVSLGKSKIYGTNPFEKAEIDCWMDWGKELELPVSVFLYSLWSLETPNKVHKGIAARDLAYLLDNLNAALLDKTFLVGESITLADITVAFTLYDLFTQVPDFKFFSMWKNVVRWFKTVANQPHSKAVIGPTALPPVGEEDVIGCFKLKFGEVVEVLSEPRVLVPEAYLKAPAPKSKGIIEEVVSLPLSTPQKWGAAPKHVNHRVSKAFGFLGLGGDSDDSQHPVARCETASLAPEKGEKLRRLEQLFERADIDGNGSLDAQELQFLLASAFKMKENDIQFFPGALSKYAELQVRTYSEKEEDLGVGFEGFVKLYDAILADPEAPPEIKISAKSAEEDYNVYKRAKSFFGRKKDEGEETHLAMAAIPEAVAQQEDYFKSFEDLLREGGAAKGDNIRGGSGGASINKRKSLPPPPPGVGSTPMAEDVKAVDGLTASPVQPHPPARPPSRPAPTANKPPPPPPNNPIDGAKKIQFSIKSGGPSSGWGKMFKGEKTSVTLETKTNVAFTPAHLDDFARHFKAKPNASNYNRRKT